MSPVTQYAAQRIVQGATATLTAKFVDQDGEPRTPGTVTVAMTSSDGTQVIAAGTGTTPDGDGNPTITLTSAQTAQLDILMATWTETAGAVLQTITEVVGGRYLTLFDIRSIDRALQDVAKYPDEDLKRVRTEVEVECERITGRAFVPRFRVDQGDAGSVRTASARPFDLAEVDVRNVRWLKINGTAYASTYWELTTSGRLYFGRGIGLLPEQIGNGPWRGNLPVIITLGYEYGWPTPPDDLRRAMITRVRSRLLDGNTGIPDRATSTTVDGATFSLATPGIRGAQTGIPSVDAVYADYTREDRKNDFAGSLRII